MDETWANLLNVQQAMKACVSIYLCMYVCICFYLGTDKQMDRQIDTDINMNVPDLCGINWYIQSFSYKTNLF